MQITFLPASYGDCIHIEEMNRHVIIDGGPTAEPLLSLFRSIIDKGENVDLFVITHYDNDHIAGIIEALKQLRNVDLNNFIKEVWFNVPQQVDNEKDDFKLLSLKEANELSTFLVANKIKWANKIQKGRKFILTENTLIEVLYGGEHINNGSIGESLGFAKCDWNTSLKDLEKFLDDKAIDKSKTNAESIVMLLNCHDKLILLSGDSTPDILQSVLNEHIKEKGSIKFDMVKLPHHGSYKNVTKKVLSLFKCSQYIVSTNGEYYYHPDKKALLKILKWGNKDTDNYSFHFNYPSLIERLRFTEDEKKSYHFSCDGTNRFEL